MKLSWYGHASFGITSAAGIHIVTDPYDPETSGYKPFSEVADLILMSSDNDSFHCNHQLVPKKLDTVVINTLELARSGAQTVSKGIPVKAIEAMEALNHREHDPDANAMYRMEVDGLQIGHFGDIGNPLSNEQMAFFKDIDILLVLAGGHPTIELDDLKDAIDRIQPRLVIPMHFRTLRYKLRNIYWLSPFLSFFAEDQIDFACNSSISLSKQDMPDSTRVLVLTYN